MPADWGIAKPIITVLCRVWSAIRDRPSLTIENSQVVYRRLPHRESELIVNFEALNRGRRQIQIKRWGIRTTKMQVLHTAVFDLENVTLSENTRYAVTETIPAEIGRALTTGAEIFCDDVLGKTATKQVTVHGSFLPGGR